jgi:hypothetical protein
VLFVLKHILEQPLRDGTRVGERICSMAFGPGLTVETGLFTKLRQAVAGPGNTSDAATRDGLGAGPAVSEAATAG